MGLEGDALISERRGHLGELAREAAVGGARLLVVVGGDGSLHEVVNGLAGLTETPELALIPRGTGGDFVRTFGIPGDVTAAARIALTGEMQAIDLGRVTYRSWDGHEASALFANVASAGMSGAIAQRANRTSKALGAKASYLWATFAVFAGWSAVETSVAVDGETRSGRMFDVVVANGRFFGGGMKMCPDALPADGLLDVVTIGDVTKRDLVLTMPKIYRGTHLPHPKAEALRGRVVTVETDEPVPVELDGEQPGTTPARFEVLPGALRLRVPPTTPQPTRCRASMSSGPPLTIVQLTDCHLFSDRGGEVNGVATWPRLDAVLAGGSHRRTPDLDLLVVTGDTATDEAPATYEAVREALGDWVRRLRIVPGNHDDRALLRRVFPQPGGDDGGPRDVSRRRARLARHRARHAADR